jgi:hypothetical protein
MDTSELPLVKKCVEKSSEAEAKGDKIGSEEWFRLAMLAEAKYAKQDYKTADQYYKDKNDA